MWEQGLGATGYVRAGRQDPPPVRLEATGQYLWAQWRQSVRERVQARIPDPQQAGLISALLMGDQASIERADWDVFRATGVAHLVSISGLHVTMFAWLCGAWVRWAWRRTDRWGTSWCLYLPADQAGRWAGLGLAVLYALFSGWGIPAQRTIWMLTWVSVLASTGRRWPWPQVWLSTCTGVLLVDPWALGQAGFWLSFVAVGVLFATGQGAPPASQSVSWAQRLWRLWREQWVITVCLAPLSLWLFQQVSVVGLLANAVAIPWVTLWVTPLCLLGTLFPHAWEVAAGSWQVLMVLLQSLANWPGAVWSTPAPAAWATAAATLGSLLLAMRLPWVLRAIGLPLMAPALLWNVPSPAPGDVEVWFPDIGQGHAVLVRTAEHVLLFDAGPRYSRETDAGQRVLLPLLRAWGWRLDAMVLSHSDSDHIGGAPAVLQMNPAMPWWGSLPPSHPLHQSRPGQACHAGVGWDWDGVRFDFLHPIDANHSDRAKPNTMSCVLKVQARGASVLLTGDIEAAQEKALVAHAPVGADGVTALRADVLLVPHHGSNTSSTAEFLAAVAPRWAWVQAGYRNRYGHPTAAVMARYQSLGIGVKESVRCGAGRWRSAQPDEVHCERQAQPRYWHHRVP
jgi:competence protein ComEC